MAIRQLSVFLENTPGSLSRFAKLMSEYNINLFSATMADTTNYGLLRVIADDTDRALQVLTDHGYMVTMTEVLVVSLPDRPGGFASMLAKLAEKGISVEYMYSTVRSPQGNATLVIQTDDRALAEKTLQEAGVMLPSEAEIRQK